MSGAYSSIFIASPLLAWMKEREPRYRDLAARVTSRADRRVLTATSAALAGAQASVGGSRPPPARREAPSRGPSRHARVSGNAVNAPVG